MRFSAAPVVLSVGLAAAGAAAAAPDVAPVLLYHGGAAAPVLRLPDGGPADNRAPGQFAVQALSREAADRRQQFANALKVDLATVFQEQFESVGLQSDDLPRRRVLYFGIGDEPQPIGHHVSDGGGSMLALVVDYSAFFRGGRLEALSTVSFLESGRHPAEGPRLAVAYRSARRAPETARQDPLFDDSTRISEVAAAKNSPARLYWFGGSPSAADEDFTRHSRDIAVLVDTLLLETDDTDEVPDLEAWYAALLTGKRLFSARGSKCPRQCSKKYVVLGSGRYGIVEKERSIAKAYRVRVFGEE